MKYNPQKAKVVLACQENHQQDMAKAIPDLLAQEYVCCFSPDTTGYASG